MLINLYDSSRNMMLSTVAGFSCFVLLFAYSHADTPANCTYEEITGQWTFFVGEEGKDRSIDCSSFGKQYRVYFNFSRL